MQLVISGIHPSPDSALLEWNKFVDEQCGKIYCRGISNILLYS